MKTLCLIIISVLLTTSLNAQWVEKVSGTSNNLTDVHFPTATTGYAVGVQGTAIKTTDGGDNWVILNTGVNDNLEGVHFLDENAGFACGEGLIIKTTDGGLNWSLTTLPIQVSFRDIEFTDALNGYCVGMSGTILKTTDGGNTWIEKTSNSTRYLTKIQFPSANVGYAVATGYNSHFLKTIDAGETWVEDTIGTSTLFGSIEAVYFTDDNTGIVGSWYIAGLARTTDGGDNWVDVGAGHFPNIYSIDFINAQGGLAVGWYGEVYATNDGGITWSMEQLTNTASLLAVQFIGPEVAIAVGEGGTIVKNEALSLATEAIENIEISLFPNPAISEITLNIPDVLMGTEYQVIDNLGRIVLNGNIESTAQELNISELAPGIYTLLLPSSPKVLPTRFIKQ